MRAAILAARFCLKHRSLPLLRRFPQQPISRRLGTSWAQTPKLPRRRGPLLVGVVMAALSPSAFLKLAEDTKDNERTGEMQMLEASRAEVRKKVPTDAHGLSKLCHSVYVFLYCYVYDPIATGFRFLHLAFIFVPVVVTVPAIWLGRKVRTKNGVRTGTIWWYKFLVNAMERAGPAFIKVSSNLASTSKRSIISSD